MRKTAKKVASHCLLVLVAGYSSLGCSQESVVLFEVPTAGCSEESGCTEGGSGGRAGGAGRASIAGQSGTLDSAGSGGFSQREIIGGSTNEDAPVPSDCSNGTSCHARPGQPEGGTSDAQDCLGDSDCPASWLCFKEHCGDSSGRCQQPPAVCDDLDGGGPVCGCDDVTYWSDCRRRQSGIFAATKGQCPASDHKCRSAADCTMAGGYCARIVSLNGTCNQDAEGTCWVLPPTCPSLDTSGSHLATKFMLCDPAWEGKPWSHGLPPQQDGEPDSGFGGFLGTEGQPRCSGVCEAIKTGRPYHQLDTDLCPSRP